MAANGAIVDECFEFARDFIRPGRTRRELDEEIETIILGRKGQTGVQGFSWFSGVDLHLGQRRGRARHPGRPALRGRRHRGARYRRSERRLLRGRRPDDPGGAHLQGSAAAARGHAGRRWSKESSRRDRGTGCPDISHAVETRAHKAGYCGREVAGGTRHRAADARRSAGSEFRSAARRGRF